MCVCVYIYFLASFKEKKKKRIRLSFVYICTSVSSIWWKDHADENLVVESID